MATGSCDPASRTPATAPSSYGHACLTPGVTWTPKTSAMLFKNNHSGTISAQGILHLRNPNLGPNSAKRILGRPNFGPRILGSNFLVLFFPGKEALKNSPSRNLPPKIHLPKFKPRNWAEKIHMAPLQLSGPSGLASTYTWYSGLEPKEA